MSATLPTVSVVLPTYNRARTLPRAMQSVLRQTFCDFELLVVDDGSTDSTAAVVAACGDARVRYVRRAAPGGVAAARNAGITEARGVWLAFQDSDDEWLLDKLERQLAAARAAGPGCTGVLCGLIRVRAARVQCFYAAGAPAQRDLEPLEVIRDRIAFPQAWLVRRDQVAAAGGFDESLPVLEDWELMIRLVAPRRWRLLPEPLVVSTQSPDSLSLSAADWPREVRRIMRKHVDYLRADPELMAAAEYLLARHLVESGDLREARAALARSLRASPARPKTWLLLALSCLGRRASRRLLAARGAA